MPSSPLFDANQRLAQALKHVQISDDAIA